MVFVYAAVVIGILLWLAMCLGALVMAVSVWQDGDWHIGVVVGLVGALLLVAPPAIYYSEANDPHAAVLCLRGHEEWFTESTPVLVGKVVVPMTSTNKSWVCEQWDAR